MKKLASVVVLFLSCLLGACGSGERAHLVSGGETATANVFEPIMIQNRNVDRETIVVSSETTGETFEEGTDYTVAGLEGGVTAIFVVQGGKIRHGDRLLIEFDEL